MATTRAVKISIHEHPIFPSARIDSRKCRGCGVSGLVYGGYLCNDSDCKALFHKECAEAPSEINHSSHQQHPLLLTNDLCDYLCDLCGQKRSGSSVGYHCSTCEFKVDLTCGMKPPPSSIDHPTCHDHPLGFLKKQENEEEKEKVTCELCKDSIGGPSYSCLDCDVYFHVDCVHLSKEVNHPCHINHPLKLIAAETLTDDEDQKTCLLCGVQQEYMLYHCSVCNFTACFVCTKSPPPLFIEHAKTHKHQLTLFPNGLAYTCRLSGLEIDNRAYMCLPCGFVVHGHFINLPRVININRHDHRISFTHHLGPGYLGCGVCHKTIDHYTGAYACKVCTNFAVHSHCAVSHNIWDGVELEGISETIEDIAPFKVMGENLISHFSHVEHTLRLQKNFIVRDEGVRCEACTYPVGFDPIYSCEDCHFILHEKCANLPMKKRLVFSNTPLTLVGSSGRVRVLTDCVYCGACSTGFKYVTQRNREIDIHCASLSEPFVHDGHLHPLYFDRKKNHYCNGCHTMIDDFMFCCDGCDFDLCLNCASLPRKITHRNDEHPLTLSCGEKADGQYWCDMCEAELYPSLWFYTCVDCGITLHLECVIGDFLRLMPGHAVETLWGKFDVVLNNHNTRPLCSICRSRCKVSVILKGSDEDNFYICSRSCYSDMVLARS